MDSSVGYDRVSVAGSQSLPIGRHPPPPPQNCRDEEFPFRKDAFPANPPPRDAYHNAPTLLVSNGLVTWPWRVRGLEVCAQYEFTIVYFIKICK